MDDLAFLCLRLAAAALVIFASSRIGSYIAKVFTCMRLGNRLKHIPGGPFLPSSLTAKSWTTSGSYHICKELHNFHYSTGYCTYIQLQCISFTSSKGCSLTQPWVYGGRA